MNRYVKKIKELKTTILEQGNEIIRLQKKLKKLQQPRDIPGCLEVISINGEAWYSERYGERVRMGDPRKETSRNTDGMPYVIVRCRNAGVHAGYLVSRDSETLVLTHARRLWRWHGRTLSGLAIEGTDDADACKFGDPIDVTLNASDWCEIIPCTQ